MANYTVDEVRNLYDSYQKKKSLIDQKNAVIAEKQRERTRIEEELKVKYGPDYRSIIENDVQKLKSWVTEEVNAAQ